MLQWVMATLRCDELVLAVVDLAFTVTCLRVRAGIAPQRKHRQSKAAGGGAVPREEDDMEEV